MLGIGFTEMVLIAGLALIIIGPEKFPDFAKLVVRTIRDLRGYVEEMKDEVSKELKPIKKEMDTLSRIDPEKYIDSLTKEAPAPPANPSLHEEDRKVMEEAGAYDEDPYGWDGAEPGGYDREPGGAAPEDTVGYGAGREKETTAQQPEDVQEEGTPREGAAEDVASDDATPEEGAPEEKKAARDTAPGEPAPESEFDMADNAYNTPQDNEPDVWTGR